MNAIARGLTLALIGCLTAPLAAHAQKQPAKKTEDLERIHILMVIDSDSNLGEGVVVDKKRMLMMWERTIPEKRYTLKILEGGAATKKNILKYYTDLKVGPNEGVVFYYAGHGVNDKDTRKHHIVLTHSDLLRRDELVQAMKAKRAELVVLLTDCCSTPQKLSAPTGKGMDPPEAKGKILPTVGCLFFQTRGLVNITAATDGPSWGDKDNGGVFTRALCQLLYWDVSRLDENKDGFVDWSEFFRKLKPQTETGFDVWRKAIISRAPKDKLNTDRELIALAKKTTFQIPSALDKLPVREAKGWLLARIKNSPDDTVQYEWSLDGEKWKERTLEPGTLHRFPVPFTLGPRSKPRLHLREKGRRETETVEFEWWEGSGKPKDGDYTKTHLFPGKK